MTGMRDHLGRAWKLVIVVAAGLATGSFFAPFIALRHAPAMVPVSAYRIVIGFDDLGQVDPALRDLPERARDKLLASWNDAIQHEPLAVEGKPPPENRIPYYYLSAVLLLAVAAVALARRQLGFWGALFTFGSGLYATWGWTRELVIERRISGAANLSPHIAWGATLLATAGALALVAGIGALLWPDPGGFRARRKIAAVLRRGEGPIAIDMPTAEQDAKVPTATLRRSSARSDAKPRA
jgi:hypothetical protein